MASTYSVQVIPDASGWSARLEPQLDATTRRIAENIKRQLQNAVRDGLSGAGLNTRVQGTRTGQQYGDAFSRAVKTRIEAALRSLPTVEIGVATTAAQQKLKDLSARIRTLGDDIELGVDDKKAKAELDALRAELRALTHDKDIRVRVDARAALAEIEGLKGSLNDGGRGNFITRLFDDIRNKSPLVDKLAGKLGSLGDVLGKAQPFAVPYLIVSALSLIGPLAGAGTAALFGLAGAAGVAGLAFVGLKEQMEAGVGQGAKLRQEFSAIGREAGTLGRLAADAFGPGLNNALDTIRRALPGFAPLIAVVGERLGNAVRKGTFGLVTAFQRAQPLILQFSSYIEKGATAFEKFTLSKQFGDFLSYASQELPKVGSAIGDLAKGLVSVGVAMKTLGDNTVATLGALGKTLGVLGKIASAKIPGTSGGVLDQLGLNSAGGVLGNIANPLGFGINAFSAANDARKNGTPEAQAKAQAYITSRQNAYAAASTGNAATLSATNGAYAAATQAASAEATQLAATTLQMRLQNDAAGLLKAALDGLSGKNLGVAQSLTSFQTGLLGLSDTFSKATFSSTALTTSAVAQRGALESAVAAAQAHAEAVGAQTGSTVKATAALQADYGQIVANTGATGANKAAIYAYIQQIGKIPPVATTHIDLIDNASSKIRTVNSLIEQLPNSKTITINTRTGGQAVSAEGNLFNSVKAYAVGGIADKLRASVASFAMGGESHLPQIASPRAPFRVWAEPETGGEAYIPLANDYRRQRAQDIWLQTGKRIGMMDRLPAPAAPAVMASSGLSDGTPVNVNVIDHDGTFASKMRGEIAADKRTTARQSVGGSASVVR